MDSGEVWRGGQAQVFHLAQHLASGSTTQHLLAKRDSELHRRAREDPSYRPSVHAHPIRGEWDVTAYRYVLRLHDRHGFDVIHPNDPHAHAVAWGASFLGELPPVVVTRRLEKPVGEHLLSRWKYRFPDAFVAISESVRRALEEGGVPPETIEVIPEGVDVRAARNAEPAWGIVRELGLDPDRPILGTVGALCEQKDHDTFIRAARRIRDERPETQFLIAGKGERRQELRNLIEELDLAGTCVLAGFHEDIFGLIKTFDLFVLTSVYEGLCSTLLQVMACEVPILATAVGGVPDVVEDGVTGELVPPRSSSEVATSALELLEDPQRGHQYVERAGRRVDDYDYPTIGGYYRDAFEELIHA